MTIEIKDMPINETEGSLLDVIEGNAEISEITEAIESLMYRIEGLEALAIALEAFDTHTPTTAALTQITTNMIRQGTDLTEDEVVPGLESIGATSVSLEGVMDTIKRAAMKVMEFITSLWTRFIAWVNNFFDQTERLKRKLAKLKEKLKTAGAKPVKETLTLMPGVAKFLAVGKTPISDKSIRESINALNEAMFFTNGLVKGTLEGWSRSKTSFEKLIKQDEFFSTLEDRRFESSESYKHVDNIMYNLAPQYKAIIGFSTDYKTGLPLPGGKVIKGEGDDIKTDDASYATQIVGGEVRSKVNMLRLYTTTKVLISNDPISKDYESSFSVAALSKADTLSILESLENLLGLIGKFRNEYRGKLNNARSEMTKLCHNFKTIFTIVKHQQQSIDTLNDPRSRAGLTELVRLLSTVTLMTYSSNLTQFPAKIMTIAMRSAVAMENYLTKCTKALGVEVTSDEKDEGPVNVPTLALPNPA